MRPQTRLADPRWPPGPRRSRWRTLAGCAGLAGPALFTAAWLVSSWRQAGHPPAEVQLSGLAADDARDPQIMIAGFVVLGACTFGVGAALRRAAGPGQAGPWLVMAAGTATVAAGVFRRDHMLLTGPGFAGESWHNQVHDVVSGIAYAAMLAAPLVLGRRWRDDPDWAVLSRPLVLLALAAAASMAVFSARLLEPWNGIVQRIAVTLALAAEALVATRLLAGPQSARTQQRVLSVAVATLASEPSRSAAPGKEVSGARPQRPLESFVGTTWRRLHRRPAGRGSGVLRRGRG